MKFDSTSEIRIRNLEMMTWVFVRRGANLCRRTLPRPPPRVRHQNQTTRRIIRTGNNRSWSEKRWTVYIRNLPFALQIATKLPSIDRANLYGTEIPAGVDSEVLRNSNWLFPLRRATGRYRFNAAKLLPWSQSDGGPEPETMRPISPGLPNSTNTRRIPPVRRKPYFRSKNYKQ